MKSFTFYLSLLLFLVFFHWTIQYTEGHICLINPPQRGGYNISSPGQMSCFHPQAPCGKTSPEEPRVEWRGGTGVNVKFQQNLNHYNPGYPGFMDVAWAEGSNPVEENFVVMSRVNDWWSHSQADQTNFTVHVNVLDIDCEHCVIRVRYVPNKPTEPIFYNCADVTIKKIPIPEHVFQNKLLGFYQPRGRQFDSQNKVADIFSDGSIVDYSSSFILRGGLPLNKYQNPRSDDLVLANGLMTVSSDRKSIYAIADTSSSVQKENKPLKKIVKFHISFTGGFDSPVQLTGMPQNMQVTSLINAGGNIMIVGLAKNNSGYEFSLHDVDPSTGKVSDSILKTKSDNTFVNFLWATTSKTKRSSVYLLVGDENAPFSLRSRLYTLDLKRGTMKSSILDNSKFTLSAVHWDDQDGGIYGLSPGLLKAKPYQWTLVRIDPDSGHVKAIGPKGGALPGDVEAAYYGGNVYGDAITSKGELVHVFHRTDGSAVLGTVDLHTGKWIYATDLDQGINQANELVSVIRLD